MTGVRVNEGTALWWNGVDFKKKRLRVHHMLVMSEKTTPKQTVGNGLSPWMMIHLKS